MSMKRGVCRQTSSVNSTKLSIGTFKTRKKTLRSFKNSLFSAFLKHLTWLSSLTAFLGSVDDLYCFIMTFGLFKKAPMLKSWSRDCFRNSFVVARCQASAAAGFCTFCLQLHLALLQFTREVASVAFKSICNLPIQFDWWNTLNFYPFQPRDFQIPAKIQEKSKLKFYFKNPKESCNKTGILRPGWP